MSKERVLNQPVDAYKAIIDELVKDASTGVSERLVRKEGIYSRAPGEKAANALVQSLTPKQRLLLAKMLRNERTAAIHDVLAELTWWVIAHGVGFTFRGQPMPVDLSGMGLHGDFIGRQSDWEWPETDADGELNE